MTAYQSPFQFGTLATDENFIDRVEDRALLKQLLSSHINVMLISPRRWGKSSLVKKATTELTNENQDIRICYIDAFSIGSEAEFYRTFASKVIACASSKFERWITDARKFLSGVVPQIVVNDQVTDFVAFDLKFVPQEEDKMTILNLPEMLAKEKNIKIIVCIDEFQQIGEFTDSLTIQKRLRGVWQHHQNVSYCFFGSKKHLMENIFQSRRMPFYQFGEMLHLKCIPTEYWVPFICSRFEKYGKKITEEYADRICQVVKNYSSYVQQLAWNVMAETGKEVNEESFEEGLKALLEQNSSLFIQQTEGLTTYQLNFIRLLCKDIHSGFTTQAVSEIYPLGSKSNIDRIKKSLVDKEIITIEKDGIFLADSVFELWFKREMM